MSDQLEKLKYPIGRYQKPTSITPTNRAAMLRDISSLPQRMVKITELLDKASLLDRPYRKGGWTPRQIIHHVADSHMNSLTRIKLALTEQNPTIKPYDQDAWATLVDYDHIVYDGLTLINVFHKKICSILEGLSDDEWKSKMIHPEWEEPFVLDSYTDLIRWHGDHHLAQLESTYDRLK